MSTQKINAAESIRGLACLAVVLSHLSLTFFSQLHNFGESAVPQYALFAQLHNSPLAFFYSGTGAVFVFFVLSGAGLWASLFTVIMSIMLAYPYSRYVDDAAIKISNQLASRF